MVPEHSYNEFLDHAIREFGISKNSYCSAIATCNDVASWLSSASYQGFSSPPKIYVQGSFRLGTVIKPVRNQVELGYYDIDLVCEFHAPTSEPNPQQLKHLVGNRLIQNNQFKQALDDEGKRCWTLKFRDPSGCEFHIDVLPSISNPVTQGSSVIAVTDKTDRGYFWSSSDPLGYGSWFDSINGAQNASQSCTPLQRAIQIMKRHRDVSYGVNYDINHPPISVIISTLAAYFYHGEPTTLSALEGIVSRIYEYEVLQTYGRVTTSSPGNNIIQRTDVGDWYIGNPVNHNENFADRWHEDNNAGARNFFSWIGSMKEQIIDFRQSLPIAHHRKCLSGFLCLSERLPYFDLLERHNY